MTCVVRSAAVLALLSLLTNLAAVAAINCTSSQAHSRKKRLIYLTSERRLTLPPASVLVLTPTLSLPFGRNLPVGYGASMTISIPFKIDFEQLGLTSVENPFGIFPTFGLFRKKRETFTPFPGVNWAGGDREMMYQVMEDSLYNVGLNGKACLLRAICEMFQLPLINHGFFGEVLELFFSASRAPYAEKRLRDYIIAERTGRSTGDCTDYHLDCPHSLFTNPGQSEWTGAEEAVQHCAKENNNEDETDKSAQEHTSRDKSFPDLQNIKATKKTKKTRKGSEKYYD